jgi:ABC-type multidrug transport system fused ATPase/permease subunit
MNRSLTDLFLKILSREEKFQLIGINIINLLINALDILFLAILLWILNFYSQPKTNHFLIPYTSLVIQNQSLTLLWVFLFLFIIKNTLGYFSLERRNAYFFSLATRISDENLKAYLNQKYDQYIEEDSSIPVRKISQEPIEFITYILINVQEIISQVIIIFLSILGILFYNPGLFLGLFLILLPPLIILTYTSRRRLFKLRKGIKESSEKSIQTLREALDSFITSNISDKKKFFQNRYLPFQKELNGYIALQQSLQGLPIRFLEVFAVLGYSLMLWIFSVSKTHGANLLLDTGIFLTASYKIIPGVVKMMNCISQIKTYSFTIKDLSSSKSLIEPKNPLIPKKLTSLSFQNIYFKFGSQPVLKNLSFEIQSGNFIVLTGKSGSGKSTLINLILGFLSQNEGNIYFNEEKLDSEKRRDYWHSIAYVNQEPFIIQDTLAKNISLSDDIPTQDILEKIIQTCELKDFIHPLKKGLETMVLENGKNLSGGQKQRLMIARALYGDFDLLILDEALSEVDEGSSTQILKNLKELSHKGKMILFITHNPNYFGLGDVLINLNEP